MGLSPLLEAIEPFKMISLFLQNALLVQQAPENLGIQRLS